MFPTRFFPTRYFAARYFPKVGAEPIIQTLTHLGPHALPMGLAYGSFAGRTPTVIGHPSRRGYHLPPWQIPIGPTHVRVL